MYPGTRSRQRENASNHAVELRLLAERKAGEALKGLERGRNQYDSGSAADTLSGASEYQQALEESGVSERQAQRWQEIKLRIERRAGELLLAKQRGQGQRNDLLSEVASESSEYRDALDRLAEQGTSERTARDWQKIARSERRAGEILSETPLATGGQPYQGISTGNTVLPVEGIVPTLSEIGIGKMQSSRWQMLAGLPDGR